MSGWQRTVAAAALPPGSRQVVAVAGVEVALFNLGGELFAVEDVCTHDGAPLADGEVAGDQITCPRHGARFSLRTGAVLAPPAYAPLPRYEVRVVEGWIEVREGE